MTARHRGVAKLWLLNLFGNAALLSSVYFWLLLPDAHGWQVALSAGLAIATILFGLWLRAGSFAYFRLTEFRENATVGLAFRHAIRHMIALAVCAIPMAVIEWELLSLRRYTPQFGVWFWQKVPLVRFGSPRQLYHTSDYLLWLLMALLLCIWLPIASTVAAVGLRPARMARSLRTLKRLPYWLWICGLTLIGAYLPYKLVWWIPDLSTLTKQAWSAGLRFALAYVLLISAWVALLFVVGVRAEKEDSDPL